MKTLALISLITLPFGTQLNNITITTSGNNVIAETDESTTNIIKDKSQGQSIMPLMIFQKTSNNSQINNYYLENLYNYSNVWQNSSNTLNLALSFIIEIQPYISTESTQIDLKIKFADFNISRQMTTTCNIYKTTTDLSSQTNDQITWNSTTPEIRLNNWKTSSNYSLIKTQNITNWLDEDYTSEIEIELPTMTINKNEKIYIFGGFTYQVNNAPTSWDNTKNLPYVNKTTITAVQSITSGIEVVDIPDLMFTIIGMPFSFISQAFDLTLFAGTPYQVNISKIFLGFIAVALLLWVLKLILGKADFGEWIGTQKNSYEHTRSIQKSRAQNNKLKDIEKK